MKAIIISCSATLILFAAVARAGELREIELFDGTVITGEVLSLTGGVYSVKSDSLGSLRIEESKIRTIRSKSPAGNGSQNDPASASHAGVRSLQDKMMSDKEIMTMIQSLQNDPEFKKMLEDPEVMKAVNAGDVAALMANPAFLKLLSNPTVQDIQKKVN